MGMISIDMRGSFPRIQYETCAENGGHVMAIKRAIQFLTNQLGDAVINDAELTRDGIVPPRSPLGKD